MPQAIVHKTPLETPLERPRKKKKYKHTTLFLLLLFSFIYRMCNIRVTSWRIQEAHPRY